MYFFHSFQFLKASRPALVRGRPQLCSPIPARDGRSVSWLGLLLTRDSSPRTIFQCRHFLVVTDRIRCGRVWCGKRITREMRRKTAEKLCELPNVLGAATTGWSPAWRVTSGCAGGGTVAVQDVCWCWRDNGSWLRRYTCFFFHFLLQFIFLLYFIAT